MSEWTKLVGILDTQTDRLEVAKKDASLVLDRESDWTVLNLMCRSELKPFFSHPGWAGLGVSENPSMRLYLLPAQKSRICEPPPRPTILQELDHDGLAITRIFAGATLGVVKGPTFVGQCCRRIGRRKDIDIFFYRSTHEIWGNWVIKKGWILASIWMLENDLSDQEKDQ